MPPPFAPAPDAGPWGDGSNAQPAPLGGSRTRRRWANVGIVVGTIGSAAVAAASVTPRMDGTAPGATSNDISAVGFLVSIAAAVGLCWRFRSPNALLITAALACLPGLLLPTDSLPALVAMASVIVWHPDVRAHLAATAGAGLATFVAVWRDTRGTRSDTSFWNSMEHPNGSPGSWPPMPWWQVALITAVLVALFAGVALIRRSRRAATQADAHARQARALAEHQALRAQEAHAQAKRSADDERRARAQAQQFAEREHLASVQAQELAERERRARAEAHDASVQAHRAEQQMHDLGRQMAEKDEREALAREVHDVLGHRLSILSMQANALEIEAQQANSRDVEDRARQIQEGAAGSMDDLRGLLAMLRTGSTATGADDHSDLSNIADLVRECIDAGTPVSSNVFVDQSVPLDPVISRSAHRITTELLTNARKHAPGRLVQLDIRGDARGGITISAANPLPEGPPARSGDAGTGLTGVARRAADVGGSFWAGPSPDGRRFTASATLPWVLPGRDDAWHR